MEELFYLTDKIVLSKGKMFYNKVNKNIKINKNNWHIYLNDYGWEKLPKQWIIKLNKFTSHKNNNSKYGIYDCEKDGNCFFQCIANGLNDKHRYDYLQYNHEDIRNLIAESITEDIYKNLIKYYRIMRDADDFDEEWDPYSIENIDDFKRQIRQTGHNYWGDYLLLNTIIQVLKLNIFILNSNEKDYSVYNTLNDYNSEYDSIFLLFVDNCHFKLIGSFDDNLMISYFNDKNIPEELINLLNLK